MSLGRGVVSGCVLDGGIYVVGGGPTASSVTATCEMYDPVADSWTPRASMPSARCGHATCAVDGKIYVFGGMTPDVYSTARSNVYQYDPQADIWTEKGDMPHANALCGIAVVDGIVYLIGGTLGVSSPPVSTLLAYDPSTDSWTRKADMPTARFWFSASAVDGKIYAIGGCTENWGSFSYPHVEVYDPAADAWTRKADMPTARFGLGTCVVDGKIYAVGGHLPDGATAANEVYDPVLDTWTAKAPLQHKRVGHVQAAVGDKVYVMGGSYPNPAPTILGTVEEYVTGLARSPDFNGDWQITIEDLLLLIERWGSEDSLCDIAPPPFGDGIVDRADLEVLMSYWGQELDDPALVAHWKFDEAEGTAASDSTGDHDGSAAGIPVWQPDGGQVGGAVQLDGGTFFPVGFVLSPGDGPFSVFAWVQGGGPGQAVVSQAGGANWLMAGAPDGVLMTNVKGSGRTAKPLVSGVDITDGAWHRVGFTWDGANRILYVDNIEVARDTQTGLAGSAGGLYVGADSVLSPGAFWTGLIDDVRVYDQAVKP